MAIRIIRRIVILFLFTGCAGYPTSGYPYPFEQEVYTAQDGSVHVRDLP